MARGAPPTSEAVQTGSLRIAREGGGGVTTQRDPLL
jgi:hypothetical protein